jgi:succinoglycan biosynthesis protein ExoO
MSCQHQDNTLAGIGAHNMKIDVSIIIAAFNAQGTLSRALDSVLAQSKTTWEVIVVDDCSVDDTYAIAMRYAKQNPRIRVLQTPSNSGPSAARNLALNSAKGEYFTVLDADDWFASNRVEILIKAAHNQHADVVVDSYFLVKPATTTCYAAKHTNLCPASQTMTIDTPFFIAKGLGATKPLVKIALLNENDLRFDESIKGGEDLLLYAQVLMKSTRCLFINQSTYFRTEAPYSLSRADRVSFLNAVLNVFATLNKTIYQSTGGSIELQDAIRYREMVTQDALAAEKWKQWFITNGKAPFPSLASIVGLVRHLWCRKARYSINVLS